MPSTPKHPLHKNVVIPNPRPSYGEGSAFLRSAACSGIFVVAGLQTRSLSALCPFFLRSSFFLAPLRLPARPERRRGRLRALFVGVLVLSLLIHATILVPKSGSAPGEFH